MKLILQVLIFLDQVGDGFLQFDKIPGLPNFCLNVASNPIVLSSFWMSPPPYFHIYIYHPRKIHPLFLDTHIKDSN